MPRAHASSHDGVEGQKDKFLVIGIGASAGGLDVFRKFLNAMPGDSGMAFILVQHLDPSHDSLIAELLTSHTSMKVRQAVEGMRIVPNCVFVIPPGTSLSLNNGLFHMSATEDGHGARLPFDHLLRSLAEEVGERAVGIILSGTGADGSVGLRALKRCRGFIIAQDPLEADYQGMPESAIETGLVDRVLPVAKIPDALKSYRRWLMRQPIQVKDDAPAKEDGPLLLNQIIELLRANSVYDFTLYKRGTLIRRIERRMAIAEIEPEDMEQYLQLLTDNPTEMETLAKELLINVTNFFRDASIFNLLAEQVIPDVIDKTKPGEPIRIWSVGCSSGEEAYSLVMLFMEQIALSKRRIKLQIFASDLDPDAIKVAREGWYSQAIAADVSAERLARFFTVDGTGYRVSQKLRDAVIFTVQDVLVDPPFSRVDMVSCRNLLIYLLPDAQAKVISMFEFALKDDGILLLGASETLNPREKRFLTVFKSERIYRLTGGRVKRLPDISQISHRTLLADTQSHNLKILPRQTFLADLCRRLVLEAFAPASVLINSDNQCIFTLGATAHYLRVVSGHPTNDILAMAYEDVRGFLRDAIARSEKISERITIEGGHIKREGRMMAFHMVVQPIHSDGENFLLICFVETPEKARAHEDAAPYIESTRLAELEKELNAKKIEITTALYNIEILTEAQTTINAEALSANEEFQATNEELLTSKEELQSLNEELSALNTQLQETLEHQRRTSNDLQNVLNSTDVATIFLDTQLRIRFFTPSTHVVFNIIQGDIGRPLSDLSPLSADDVLLDHARLVIDDRIPRVREVKAIGDKWYNRRVLPYQTDDGQVDGVVITYQDISHQKQSANTLDAARHVAELSNATKSRFLASASHDLRQPLQTLLLLHGMLEPAVEDPKAKELVSRIGTTLSSVSGMLNALLDINRIDAGVTFAEKTNFNLNDLLSRLRDEFRYHAEAKGLRLKVVLSDQVVISDPSLLEQILRNLLANALKFTVSGKVLLGCRRSGNVLRIQIWDTGIGIAHDEVTSIFNEYHQVGGSAHGADRGLGLGLAIVMRLSKLLDHPIDVKSHPGRGTVFSISIDLPERAELEPSVSAVVQGGDVSVVQDSNEFHILLIEDNAEVLELLEFALKSSRYNVRTARSAAAATRILTSATTPPDLIVADFNMSDDTNGLQLALKFREKFNHDVPVIVLTGDISTNTLRRINQSGCVHAHKPIAPDDLELTMRRLLRAAKPWQPDTPPREPSEKSILSIVEDDSIQAERLRKDLLELGYTVNVYSNAESFLQDYQPGGSQCLILDAYLPGMSGIKLLRHLKEVGSFLPTIMITGLSDTQIAVDAMRAGAINFIEKPIKMNVLHESITHGLEQSNDKASRDTHLENIAQLYATLTARQVEVMELVLAGHPSKNIAADLGISRRTVENHRAAIMTKTKCKSLPALARFAGAIDEMNRE